MQPATHNKLAGIALLLWLAFWVSGLPHYYQQYPFWAMLVFCLALVPAIVLVAWKVILTLFYILLWLRIVPIARMRSAPPG